MENIVWQNSKINENARIKNMGQRGLVLWFTGPSGSGKSTIAMQAEAELTRLGFIAYVLDGDNLRHGINSDMGFSKTDRDENIRRICEIANLFCGAQVITISSTISPFAEARRKAREKIGSEKFCEIYIRAGLETRKSRDPKGLYKKFESGEIDGLVGLNFPYEEPENPELTIDTEKLTVDEAVKIIVQWVLEQQCRGAHCPSVIQDMIYAAYDAGKVILDIYKKDFAVEYKDDKTPLTEADKKANGLICGRLRKYAPYIDILSEESVGHDDPGVPPKRPPRLDNKFCFIVDPLDGTKEFVKKNGEFTVNIGLAYNGRPIMGVVYAPCLNKLYYAVKDHGSYAVDLNKDILKLFDEDTKIKVSGKTEELTIMKSRSHSDERTEALLEKNKHKIKSAASIGSALKGCLIAEGEADIYYRFGLTNEWDTCAAHCVVEEAGGIFVQGDWTEMTYNREDNLNRKGFIILNKIENKLEES